MSVDPKCYELAEAFLADEDPEIRTAATTFKLAQAIQDCIEDWLGTSREKANGSP